MSPLEPSDLPQSALDDTRDILTRLYDYPYLMQHRVTRHMSEVQGCDSHVALQKLRTTLLDAINGMRPERSVPESDPAWRPYAVLHHRYVLGKEPSELVDELGLGMRQIQREQRRAIEAIALVLLEKGCLPAGGSSSAEFALAEEVARAASELQAYDASEQVQRALTSVQPLAASCEVRFDVQGGDVPIGAYGSPSLLRQLEVAALSFLIRQMPGSTIRVSIAYHFGTMMLEHEAISPTVLPTQGRPDHIPESLSVLAQAQGARILLETTECSQTIRVWLNAQRKHNTVAIIDDNRDLLSLFSRYLSQTGYEIFTIMDSSVALERVTEIVPDAIVLDVMMHDIDGWELLRRIREEPRLRDTPVVVCSVLHEEELATSLGANAYLHKPVKPTQLLECLSSLLHR